MRFTCNIHIVGKYDASVLIAWADALWRHAMAPYGTIDSSVSAALLRALQLSAAGARLFKLKHKNTMLNCIGYGEMLFVVLALRAALLIGCCRWPLVITNRFSRTGRLGQGEAFRLLNVLS